MITLEQRIDALADAVAGACKCIDELRADRRALKASNEELLAACKGALAHLVNGDLTQDMALKRLREAIAKAEVR